MGLGFGVVARGDVEDQEGGNGFVGGDVVHGGVVALLGFIAAKDGDEAGGDAGAAAVLDAFRDVVGGDVQWHTTFEHGGGDALGLEVAVIGTQQGGEVGTCGVAEDDDALGITPVLLGMIMQPTDAGGDVGHHFFDGDGGEESVIDGGEQVAFFGEGLGLVLEAGFIAFFPAASVDPDDDGVALSLSGGVEIQGLEFILGRRIIEIPVRDRLRCLGGGDEIGSDEGK